MGLIPKPRTDNQKLFETAKEELVNEIYASFGEPERSERMKEELKPWPDLDCSPANHNNRETDQ